MPARGFSSCRRGIDGYPPYVQGWFCMAESGTMQRGYRDAGYLLARRLREFRPLWLGVRAWRYHVGTLWAILDRCDEQAALWWFAATYPCLVALIPADQQVHFVAGVREQRCDS